MDNKTLEAGYFQPLEWLYPLECLEKNFLMSFPMVLQAVVSSFPDNPTKRIYDPIKRYVEGFTSHMEGFTSHVELFKPQLV